MYYNLRWHITIGDYKVNLLDSVEIHKSVDLLADTCIIKLPGSVHGKALQVEDKVNAGDKVLVKLGYDDDLQTEFEGYLQRIDTDDGSLIFNCEDELFLLRKDVKDKEFKSASVSDIANYLVSQTGSRLSVNCSLTATYDKFTISRATAYDVLKKLQEETNGNIYLKQGTLHLHPRYMEKGGDVIYSFQHNIESSDLKYRKAEDRKVEVIVKRTMPDGKTLTARAGVSGGDKVEKNGDGMSQGMMQQTADNEVRARSYNGYEGSITGWLLPYCEPTWTARVKDADYPYKDGGYYIVAVTTSVDGSGGGRRKIQLDRKVY